MPSARMRPALVRLHRWIGLATALFLGVAGITGSLLAFKEELEGLINPRLFIVEAAPGAAMIDPLALRDQVQARFPQARVDQVPFPRPGASARFFLWPRPDATEATEARMPALEVGDVFFDPYTGTYLGGRKWGQLLDGGVWRRENIVPFIWRLHEALALPHPWGKLFMGVVALLWTLDCFVGVALTLPSRSPFFARWKPAWTLKPGASTFRRIFDLHRAFGLWCWLLLLVFAWSSVMLNLRTAVYQPLMSQALRFEDTELRPLAQPDYHPRLSWREAHTIGQALLQGEAARRGFQIHAQDSLWYRPALGAYLYRSHTARDIRSHGAASDVWIDADTGKMIAIHLERDAAMGNLVSEWLRALHTGRVFDPVYRVIVAALGVGVAILSATGVWIWWKKRAARTKAQVATQLNAPGAEELSKQR